MALSVFICTNCDAQTQKWAGRCFECGGWGTLQEGVVEGKQKPPTQTKPADAIPFSAIKEATIPRLTTGIDEVDQVLGGGIVPGSLILLGGEPGIGKCVTADTRILDPLTGAFLPITSWHNGSRSVSSLDQRTNRLTTGHVVAFHDQGIKPIINVTTRLGKTLHCTSNHPLLTPEGWKETSALNRGDRIASPRALPFFGNQRMEEHKIKCIAYALSDGSTIKTFCVTASIPEVEEDLITIAKKFNVSIASYRKTNNKAKDFKFTQPWEKKKIARKKFAANLCAVRQATGISWAEWARRAHVPYHMIHSWWIGKGVPNGQTLHVLADSIDLPVHRLLPSLRDDADQVPSIMRFIESVGLRGKRAATKSVPECIFLLPRKQLALFLKILFSCDGSLYINRRNQVGISYSTISKTLAQDIQHILLRFGFIARLRTKNSLVNKQHYTAYELQILGIPEAKRFIKEIGIWGRNDAKKMIVQLSIPTIPSTQQDTIPTGSHFWKSLDVITEHVSYKEISRQCGTTIHTGREDRPLTHNTLVALAQRYPVPYLKLLANNDIYWDEISEITHGGNERVYDISVPLYSNFVANDIIVHNSTLLGQLACTISQGKNSVIYCSGEESAQQVKMRFDRLSVSFPQRFPISEQDLELEEIAMPVARESSGLDPRFLGDDKGDRDDNLLFIGETNCEKICGALRHHKPALAIVDSIQTIASSDVPSEAGSIAQVRACTVKLLEVAKQENIPIIITGHVTKEGGVAGPKTLEHLVDTVLYLEGDASQYFRLLKTVKNRFGSTNEIGVFEMTGAGLVEVTNPSELFLSSDSEHAAGTATTAIVEGSRAFLVPIQALTSKTYFGYPQRKSIGIDANRLGLLVAVLSKRLGVNLGDQDIHVNVVGGLKINEPAADLAVCASILSSYKNKPLEKGVVVFGEVGLTGEVRPVSHTEKRLKEAEKLGFKIAYLPKQTKKLSSSLQLVEIKNIKELEI